MNALIFIQNDGEKILRSSIEVITGIQQLLSGDDDTITTISFGVF